MKVLIIGGGGREHALAWKIKQSKKVTELYVAPGNAGTSNIAINVNLYKTKDIVSWTKENAIDLVVVGPDNYLEESIVDKLQKENIKVFGPTKQAAKIEWSKAFAKQFMVKNSIPTAKFKVLNNFKSSLNYIKLQKFPLVIKADGLSFGKGVIIANNLNEALKTLTDIFKNKVFGKSGSKVVIEEFIQGREVSIHAFTDGKNISIFPVSKDHKKIFDGNKGPNTGGMGTVSPILRVTKSQVKEIIDEIILPTIRGLDKLGTPYVGVLYPGVFLTKDGPKVIEFNARFGDPETQTYMRLLETDLVDILLSCVDRNLKRQKIKWSKEFACCIVCASGGYPGKYKIGKKISGLNLKDKDIVVFHYSTKKSGEKVLTNGGRILGVTAIGKTIGQALSKTYKAIKKIKFGGMYYRKDINI